MTPIIFTPQLKLLACRVCNNRCIIARPQWSRYVHIELINDNTKRQGLYFHLAPSSPPIRSNECTNLLVMTPQNTKYKANHRNDHMIWKEQKQKDCDDTNSYNVFNSCLWVFKRFLASIIWLFPHQNRSYIADSIFRIDVFIFKIVCVFFSC